MGGTGRSGGGRGRLGSALSGLAVAVGCVLFLGGFAWGAVVYQPYTVPTRSMSPTVQAGDRVLAERISGDEVRRGDIVVFTDSTWGDLPMVKRVVGIGGDEIACCDAQGRLTVNGTPVDEPYLSAGGPASPQGFSASVPEGQLFLLGDERMGSVDSRVHLQEPGEGSVPRSAVSARLDAVAWPLDGGLVERPASFAALPGGISQPGPVRLIVGAIAAGVVLILGGAAYGPVAARRAARMSRRGSPGRAAAGGGAARGGGRGVTSDAP
ncbi:signal peptidase I [Streptomyces sp. HNM0663]|uniref:Signal peptidase I n=1 Tax=Streptomyces chengmaiensis TaxID=3040919 RepID=A0ABT6HRK4_9ACTN|nr:signal peptidase I [Streptomyces chengmaiensis]MDH2391357.1 signal peptidase I [Streptomyces chengmaiensis]